MGGERIDTQVDALVVGAGPAGAMTAGLLAQAGARVVLIERKWLPRHRLCGEFVSGEATAELGVLGLDVADTGAVRVAEARVRCADREASVALDPHGWSLSRHFLDAWLARRAEACGAALWLGTRLVSWRGDACSGFDVDLAGAHAGSLRARLVIGATGKHGGPFGARARGGRRGFVALKLHLLGAHGALDGGAAPAVREVPVRVELHAFPGGYVGTSPVEAGRVNVCLVVRAERLTRHAHGGGRMGALTALLARVPEVGELVAARDIDPASVCAESGMRFGRARPFAGGVLLAGDSGGAPFPLVGDGIAMALRSGRMAAAHALRFLEGVLAADELGASYAAAWRSEFARRLRWSAFLHRLLERPSLAGVTLALLGAWRPGFEYLVKRTRGELAERGRGDWLGAGPKHAVGLARVQGGREHAGRERTG